MPFPRRWIPSRLCKPTLPLTLCKATIPLTLPPLHPDPNGQPDEMGDHSFNVGWDKSAWTVSPPPQDPVNPEP